VKAFDRRPLGTFAASLYVFLCIFYCLGRELRTLASAVVLAAFIVVLIRLSFAKLVFARAFCAITAGALLASLISGVFIDFYLAGIDELSGTTGRITGTVVDVRYNSSYEGCYDIRTNPGTVGIGRAKLLFYSENGELSVGDVIECTAEFTAIDDSGDSREYTMSSGVVLVAQSVGDTKVIGHEAGAFISLAKLRAEMSARLRAGMSEYGGGFAAALLLGDRSHLPSSVSRDFRVLGISHVLALSGTHLTALFALAGRFIPNNGKKRYLRLFVMSSAVLFYMALTGFSSSVVRAGIMFIIAGIGSAIGRNTDSFTSLSVSVLIICIASPFAPYDVGLQLSYASVVGLIISDHLRSDVKVGQKKKLGKILGKAVPAIVVPVTVLPLMWLRFGEMSLAAPVANILLVPFVTVLIPVVGILLLLSFVPAVFMTVSAVVDRIILLFLSGAEAFAKTADYILPLTGAVTAVAVALLAAAFAVAIFAEGKMRRISCGMTVLFLSMTVLSAQLYISDYHNGMTVCYSSAGTDDAVFMMSDGYSVLIDSGRYPSALKTAAKMGADRGAGRINAFVLSHLHRGHTLSLSELCGNYYVDSLWLPVPYSEDSRLIYDGLKNKAETLGVNVFTYGSGEKLSFGECELFVPVIGNTPRSDHVTVRFEVRYGDERFLYASPYAKINGPSENTVRVVGIHGQKPEGIINKCADETVLISPKCAAEYDAVPDGAVMSDKTEIRFFGKKSREIKVY